MSKRRRRPRVEPLVIDPSDPFARYFRTYFIRGNTVMTLAPLGPVVPASTPEELRDRTAEAVVAATKGEEPN